MIKIAVPLSTLFLEDDSRIDDILMEADTFEGREAGFSLFHGAELFHFDIQLIHEFSDSEISFLKNVADKFNRLNAVSFHAASAMPNPEERGGIYYSSGEKPDRGYMLGKAVENVCLIRDIFSRDMVIMVENNNYYPTPAYEIITDGEFLSELVENCKMNFLFDVAHARITSFNRGIPYEEYIDSLPLDKAYQVHISGYGFSELDGKRIAKDFHGEVCGDIWSDIKALLRDNKGIKYATLEYYKDYSILKQEIRKLRRIIDEISV